MKILGFDSSNQKCTVAIYHNDKILSFSETTKPNSQAEMLLLLVEDALYKAKLTYKDIDFLAVTTGPGSFTGVRIGLAAAIGIISASNIIPIGINCLEVVNFRAIEHARNYDFSISIMNAYRNAVYLEVFDAQGVAVNKPEMLDNDLIEKFFIDYINKNNKIVITGSGLSFIPKLIIDNDLVMALPRFPNPHAKTLCMLAYKKIQSTNYSSDLSPVYIRLPDAKLPNMSK